jgi:hypothetical protein
MPDEPATSSDHTTLAGMVVDASDPEVLRRALDHALSYRGNVTITRRSTGETIEGYLFDCTSQASPAQLAVRLIPKDGSERVTIRGNDIARIEFSGKDPAAGKSFQTWVKKYVAKKLAGESANLESEPLP